MLCALRRGIGPRVFLLVVLALSAIAASACRNVIAREYEYEEDLYLELDGSATLYVNASVPALVALRAAPLDVDPKARLDRADVRAFFDSPAARVANVSTSRRQNRRYVHLRLEVPDVRQLAGAGPFDWSRYVFEERDGVYVYRQEVAAPEGQPVQDVGWDGDEQVAFRLHLPSRVPFHNAPSGIARGNILVWEQPLDARLAGEPVAIEAHMETESILASTLTLFALMIVLALGTLGGLVWLVMRRGRDQAEAA